MNRSTSLLVWWICGLILYVFEVYWFFQWWGSIGGLIAFFVPPIAVAFPFIYLAKEGFSLFFFGTWAVGLLALILGSSPKMSDTTDDIDDGG